MMVTMGLALFPQHGVAKETSFKKPMINKTRGTTVHNVDQVVREVLAKQSFSRVKNGMIVGDLFLFGKQTTKQDRPNHKDRTVYAVSLRPTRSAMGGVTVWEFHQRQKYLTQSFTSWDQVAVKLGRTFSQLSRTPHRIIVNRHGKSHFPRKATKINLLELSKQGSSEATQTLSALREVKRQLTARPTSKYEVMELHNSASRLIRHLNGTLKPE